MTGAVSLPAFAAIWTERWLAYGGGLIADTDTAELSMSMAMGRWRWKHHHMFQRHWHDGWTTGRWRELQELAQLVPGLWEAIVDHVAEHGEPYGPTKRAMYRTGEHIGWQEAEEPIEA